MTGADPMPRDADAVAQSLSVVIPVYRAGAGAGVDGARGPGGLRRRQPDAGRADRRSTS